jgi:hypothetical protein
LNIDPIGAAFFLVTRYQEVADPHVDRYGRFSVEEDFAVRNQFFDRPLADEYAEVVWAVMQRIWPGARRRERRFALVLTHDVDIAFQHAFVGAGRMILSCAADIVRRGDFAAPFRRVSQWTRTKCGNPQADPANTFDLIMDISEKAGLRSEFNFITQHADPVYDALYPLRHPWIESIARRVHERGHIIGLHGSYGNYLNAEQIKREFELLRAFCADLGIRQDIWGGRQHWLRLRMPDTLQYWNDAGLDYDSSLAYDTRIGFRSGTCRPHRLFNLITRNSMRLRERPTIVMDASVTDRGAMNLSGQAAVVAVRELIRRCRLVAGECVILWHNNRLANSMDLAVYRQVLLS